MSEAIENIIVKYSDGRRKCMKKSLCIDLSDEETIDMLCLNIDFDDLRVAAHALRYALDKIIEIEKKIEREDGYGTGEENNNTF